MKMKEVLARTGLTDRAVRLYISEDLICPQNRQSYTGRKNLDFSEEDIRQLQQIAVLRKAEFSIEQIRLLKQDSRTAAQVLQEYVLEKRRRVDESRRILSALATIPPEQEISVELICSHIEGGLQEQPVPEEDLKPSMARRIGIWIVRSISICVFLLSIIPLCYILIRLPHYFPFPQLTPDFLCHFGLIWLLILMLCSGSIFILYVCRVLRPKALRRRRIAGCILAIIGMINLLNPYGLLSLMFISPVYSETDDPHNYLEFGHYVKYYSEGVYELFPAKIPRSAAIDYPPTEFNETTEYYYYHEYLMDPVYDVYAQWQLSEEELEAELERIRFTFPKESEEVRWGEWVCINLKYRNTDSIYDANELKAGDNYDYLIFAYNKKTNMVRYIATFARDYSEAPYFFCIDWE